MGGGNAQKSAMARQKNAEKASAASKGGGGKAGMEARKGGDQGAAQAAAQAERARIKALREEKAAKEAHKSLQKVLSSEDWEDSSSLAETRKILGMASKSYFCPF